MTDLTTGASQRPPDYARIKRNINKMIDQNAPDTEIETYVASEGVTPEALRNARTSVVMITPPQSRISETAQALLPCPLKTLARSSHQLTWARARKYRLGFFR